MLYEKKRILTWRWRIRCHVKSTKSIVPVLRDGNKLLFWIQLAAVFWVLVSSDVIYTISMLAGSKRGVAHAPQYLSHSPHYHRYHANHSIPLISRQTNTIKRKTIHIKSRARDLVSNQTSLNNWIACTPTKFSFYSHSAEIVGWRNH